MWIYCTHKREDDEEEICGVHYIRSIRHSPLGLQHHCLSDMNHKLITRTLGSSFKDCTYCTNSERHCIRAATLEEIAEYQRKCKSLGIVPNGKRGGFKKIGARTTKPTKSKSKRRSSRKRVRGKKTSSKPSKSVPGTASTSTRKAKRRRTESRDSSDDDHDDSMRVPARCVLC